MYICATEIKLSWNTMTQTFLLLLQLKMNVGQSLPFLEKSQTE